MSIITANYESEIVSAANDACQDFLDPSLYTSNYTKSVMLFCLAYILADFHKAGESGTPVRSPGKPAD